MATGASNAELAVLLVDARKGLLDADPAARHHRQPAGHSPCGAGGQQDRPCRFRPGRCSTRIVVGLRGLRRRPRLQGHHGHSRSRRGMATMFRARSATHALVPGPRLLEHLETVDVEDDRAGRAVADAGAMGQSSRSRFSRLCRHDRRAAASCPATTSSWSPAGQTTRIKSIIGGGRRCRCRAGRRRGDRHARRRDRHCARRHAGRAARPPAGGRPVRRPSRLDVERQAAARAAPI